ncbi:adenylosuccinate lyase [Candidatus Bathyarchaeota archaeon]|nr:adenylosuccinate lyase [Candidatus Bathyarchaeota archaeon]
MNQNILSKRYATPKMNKIFSEEEKTRLEREFWLNILKTQRDLGLDVPSEAIQGYEDAVDEIDLKQIEEIERRTKHDVKAKIESFCKNAGGYEYIHLGMTSRDLTDNIEQIQIREAMRLVFGKYVSVLRHMLDKAREYDRIVLTARTHHQAAQPTLLGKRFSMWAEELLIHLQEFKHFIEEYPMRGIKGAVGTQFDMATLLGSEEKAQELEKQVAKEYGFKNLLSSTGQVYPRSLDYKLLLHLSTLASACESFAKTIRLMAGYELVTEGFVKGQVGSSVMPHKMNTRSTERICAFSNLLKMYVDGGSRLSGDQWEEGDVSCSAIRRVLIPDAFYTTDGLLETNLTVLNQMGAYPEVISKEVERYLPFLATTEILSLAFKHGIGREQAHSIIKKHAVAEALRMKEEGAETNKLMEKLSQEPLFREAGLTESILKELLKDKRHFLGNAESQIDAVFEKANPLLKEYLKEASYEPGDIL